MISSEILPVFIEIFSLEVPVLFKYNVMGAKYLTRCVAFAFNDKYTSVKMCCGKKVEVLCFRIKIIIFT